MSISFASPSDPTRDRAAALIGAPRWRGSLHQTLALVTQVRENTEARDVLEAMIRAEGPVPLLFGVEALVALAETDPMLALKALEAVPYVPRMVLEQAPRLLEDLGPDMLLSLGRLYGENYPDYVFAVQARMGPDAPDFLAKAGGSGRTPRSPERPVERLATAMAAPEETPPAPPTTQDAAPDPHLVGWIATLVAPEEEHPTENLRLIALARAVQTASVKGLDADDAVLVRDLISRYASTSLPHNR